MQFKLIDRAELRALVDDNLSSLTDTEFADRYLLAVAKVLKTDKARYRCYGPYWPVIKSELVAMGVQDFGSEFDEDMAANFNYDNRALNAAAAYVYSHPRVQSGELYNNTHILETLEGDLLPVAIEDRELEAQIHAAQLV